MPWLEDFTLQSGLKILVAEGLVSSRVLEIDTADDTKATCPAGGRPHPTQLGRRPAPVVDRHGLQQNQWQYPDHLRVRNPLRPKP